MDKPVLGRLSSFGRGQAESRGRLKPFFCPKSKSGTLKLLRERHVGASLELS
tara:strand:+ start:534 stop:689 length:156 start_codon:yes stop_codon:yes gene_type:complete